MSSRVRSAIAALCAAVCVLIVSATAFAAPVPRRVVIVLAPYLTWQDVMAGPMPITRHIASGGLVADMNDRSGAGTLTGATPSRGALMLSAGASMIEDPTGLSALLVAIVPIWFLLVEQLILPTGDRVTASGAAGIALGGLGVGVLFWPRISAGPTLGWMQLGACLALLGSSLCWAFGSVLSRRWKITVDPMVASGWQMLCAGCINVAAALMLGQHHRATWNATSVGAIAYLVVFGSWVGYSSYIWLLRHVPTSKVATYAYVNPVVALLLGWAFLGESLDRFIVIGAAIIVPAVALVTRSEHAADAEAPVAEAG